MTKALGIIDAQRGFMSATEGLLLRRRGFGELPVPDGEQIIAPLNRLIGVYSLCGQPIFTTQDWHPLTTAHFSDTPDFKTTWPKHCVAGSPGAALHPYIKLPVGARRFFKGEQPLEHGEDDLSYSGYYATDPHSGLSLPEWLKKHSITEVLLGGLALDYCVGKTALDLKQRTGIAVTVAIDATRGVTSESSEAVLGQFTEAGVNVTTTAQYSAKLVA